MLFEQLRYIAIPIARGGDHDEVRRLSARIMAGLESGELTVGEWAKLMSQLLKPAAMGRRCATPREWSCETPREMACAI